MGKLDEKVGKLDEQVIVPMNSPESPAPVDTKIENDNSKKIRRQIRDPYSYTLQAMDILFTILTQIKSRSVRSFSSKELLCIQNLNITFRKYY